MGAVFAMQGFGQFAAAIVALIVTVGFKGSLESVSWPWIKCGGSSLGSGRSRLVSRFIIV